MSTRAELVDPEQIETYLDVLFGRAFYKPHQFVNVRGIGEKGTAREGAFQEDCWCQPALHADPERALLDDMVRWVTHWAEHDVASYIVPAVLNQARGCSEAVELFTSVLVDLDTGDTNAKLTWLGEHIGIPTMVVESGGITDLGTPKYHAYYVFEEPTRDVSRVVGLRHTLAAAVGGDLQFGKGTPDNVLGRAHQPIRIPGSVHAKHGTPHSVRLAYSRGEVVDIDYFDAALSRAPRSPWASSQGVGMVTTAFDFGPTKNNRPDIAQTLTQEIHEGGEDRNRWSEFNRVAGFNIALARQGMQTLDTAREATEGWMLSKMVPPWPQARFAGEWHKLLGVDVGRHGAMPHPLVIAGDQTVRVGRGGQEGGVSSRVDPSLGLRGWAAHRWTQGEPPVRRFVVDGLIIDSKPHLLVAEGGAGKTFAALDLALKIAGGTPEEGLLWFGQPVREFGTTVILTTEDDAEELHIRIAEMDAAGRRFRAGDQFIVFPAVNAGGAFTLAEKGPMGRVAASPQWVAFLREMQQLAPVRLVVVDTLNTTLHGEENSATVVNEYARVLQPVCGALGAALIVTHHIRKQDPRVPIKSLDDMAAAVRGSTALSGAFRAVIGIWHTHDWGKRLQVMGITPEPKKLWRMGVLKANNPQMIRGIRYLLRDDNGLLQDVTSQATAGVVMKTKDAKTEKLDYLVAAIKAAAAGGKPYQSVRKDASLHGLYPRRRELPPCLREDGPLALFKLVESLVGAGRVVVVDVRWKQFDGRVRTRPTVDVPGGPFELNQGLTVETGFHYVPPSWPEGPFVKPT